MWRFLLSVFACVAMALPLCAKNEKTQLKQAINGAEINLKTIIADLNDQERQLDEKIYDAQKKIEKYSERKFTRRYPADELVGYLSRFTTLKQMYEDESTIREVKAELKKYPKSALKDTYLLVLEMAESLMVPYNKESNKELLNEATGKANHLLTLHKPGFEELTDQLDAYRYYMLELSRIMEVVEEDKEKLMAKKWSNDEVDRYMLSLLRNEEAEYLYEVPYTYEVLKEYITNGASLSPSLKRELSSACPDIFN